MLLKKEGQKIEFQRERVLPGNPLGMIAIFVFLIETVATVSLYAVVEKSYAETLVWFIIIFPSAIALLFFLFLWFKREALYAPRDFPDVQLFKELIMRRFEHIEIKQDAARIDRQTELTDVFRTVDRLLELEDIRSAVGVGRAFLRENEYDRSLKIFLYIKEKISKSDEDYYKIMANIAYAQIGLSKYDEAISILLEMKKIDRGKHFAPWHSLALAYSYHKTNQFSEFNQWIDYTRKLGAEDLDIDFFCNLYPEISNEIRALV